MKEKSKSFICLICFSFIILLLSGCNSLREYTQSGFYFDTYVSITIYDKDNTHAEKLLTDCMHMCEKYDEKFSISNPNSELYAINHAQGNPTVVSSDTLNLIKAGINYGDISNGLLDITIQPLYEVWSFDVSEHSTLPSDDTIQNAVSKINYREIILDEANNTITIPSGAALNLGAIAKGYIADCIKNYLIKQNVSSSIVNLGGNIQTIGCKPDHTDYSIGLQTPFDRQGSMLTSVQIKDCSVVTSGNYQRYFTIDNKVYHHILNPNTGYPAESGLNAVTIIAKSSMDADAYSTICMLKGEKAGEEFLRQFPDIKAVFIDNENTIHYYGFN